MTTNIFLCWEHLVPPLHVYNSTNGWNKPHGPFWFLNILIVIPNIPMATTCLTFPSQSHWAGEDGSSPSETYIYSSGRLQLRRMQVTTESSATTSHTPTSKLQSCFWEQRPSEGSAGHLPVRSPSYCFFAQNIILLLGCQGNHTPPILLASASSDH